MELTPGEPGGSGVSKPGKVALRATGTRVSTAGAAAGAVALLTTLAGAGGNGESVGCTWQQSAHCIIAGESQPCIAMSWQQERCANGIKQASAGATAQRTTTASSTNAPFLPTCIVYAIRHYHSECQATGCAVI
jgi:hypothetical protein